MMASSDLETVSSGPLYPSSALERVRAIWGRRWRLGVLVFLAPFCAVAALLVALPNVYRSTATVLVDRQQVPEAFVRSTVTSAIETRLQAISQEILSRSRLEKLITRFNLYPELRRHGSMEEAVERMRRDTQLELTGMTSSAHRGTTIAFKLSYLGRDPQTVAMVTNTITSFYVEEDLKVRERQATGTTEFLQVQLADSKRRLDEQERRISDFKRRSIGELPQQIQSNLATLETLSMQLRVANDSQLRAVERRDSLARQLAELEEAASTASATPADADARGGALRNVRAPEDPLARRRQILAQLLVRYTEGHPAVAQLRSEIAALEAARPAPASDSPTAPTRPTADARTTRLRETLREANAEIETLKLESARLRESIGIYRARVENTPRREQELADLSRDYDSTRDMYHSLMKRAEEARIAESMEQRQKGEQFRVLDPALPAREPDAPRRSRLVSVALVLSSGLALMAMLVAEKVNTSFHSLGDLYAFTRVPVLARIPAIHTAADLRRTRWRTWGVIMGALLLLALLACGGYVLGLGNEQLVHTLGGRRA